MAASDFSIRQHQVHSKQTRYTVLNIICEPLFKAGFIHAFTTRQGGVSALPKNSLNLSDKKDKTVHVKENQRRLLEALSMLGTPLVLGRQVHSDKRQWITGTTKLRTKAFEVDAFGSRRDDVLVGVKIADCVPVLLGDPKTKLFAAVHAGWRGTLSRILQKTVADFKKKGANPKNIIAAIGPAACGDCYEVGDEVWNLFKKEFPGWKKYFKRPRKGAKYYLNTQEANRQQLLEAGLRPKNIYLASFCTMHHNNLFFSHRKEAQGGKQLVGRQAAVIGRLN